MDDTRQNGRSGAGRNGTERGGRSGTGRSGTERGGRRALTLGVVLLGMLTLAMSMSGTTVALPGIGAELDASGPALQWVVTGYFLTASSFMLVFGALGDLLGRRRVYRAGAAVYAAGLGLSALAPDAWLLDAARALAGLGAAGVMSGGGALLASAFEGPARTRAFAAFGTTGGVGLALGPTLTGALVGSVGWRVAFGLFAAVGALIAGGAGLLAEVRPAGRARLDAAGAALFVAGLGLLMAGVTQGPANGWTNPLVLAAFGTALGLLTVFAVRQTRTAHPVLDLTLVRDRRYLAWPIAGLAVSIGFAGSLTYLPTYFQGVDGATAGQAGATMLWLTAPVLVAPLLGGRLLTRGVPARAVIAAALALIAAGNAWLTVLTPGAGAAVLAGPLLAIGTGAGLANGIIDGQAMNQVGPARAGMAAGFLNTVRSGGQAMVIAALGAALLTLVTSRVGSTQVAAQVVGGHLVSDEPAFLAQQFTSAWHVVLWTVAALVGTALATVTTLLRTGRARTAASRPVEATEATEAVEATEAARAAAAVEA
ncbi:MFS transporter [Kitasatospora sp. NPDC057198]|uniref:MFS transporter n=1 Tax=Kitasatospora sp. NPDC057198 TaxID=3346046 RepID=UPI0036448278